MSGVPSPSVAELRAEAQYAAQRLALYERKVVMGNGNPTRLAELQRKAKIARDRLAAAQPSPPPETPSP